MGLIDSSDIDFDQVFLLLKTVDSVALGVEV